jgi:hypothetical protein
VRRPSRSAALRCPSEVFAWKWGDVDWARNRFTVHSQKTEHHEGKAVRIVPIFPELRQHLLTAYEAAAPGTEYMITKHRLGSLNLRQQFERIIERAGQVPWPRLFQNLRASRETELMREYDLATVCKWTGHTPAVAAKHYAMSVDLDADYLRAAGRPDGASQAQQNAQQSAAASDGQQMTTTTKRGKNPAKFEHSVRQGPEVSSAVEPDKWAVLDSNQLPSLCKSDALAE